MGPNTDIAEFLIYYAERSEAPEYAVLLKGRWGAGKTWFVKDIVGKLEAKNIGSLYVSLNGINSTSAIDQELFRQVHPILGSKTMATAGRILSGALKTGFKIDLTGDGKEDANLTVQLPNISIPAKLKDTEGVLLIFDDIERCPVPLPELLGYLNFFVEQAGHKVVLVANESELGDEISGVGSRDQATYLRIKEKLIGKTFQIEPDDERAIMAFVNGLGDSRARQAIQGEVEVISAVFKGSKYENLRHVRQALLDLERLFAKLSDKVLDSRELVRELISQFLSLSFEIKSGEIDAAAIGDVFRPRFRLDKSEGTQLTYQSLTTKYPQVSFQTKLMPPELWEEILDKGRIDAPAIEEALTRSTFLAKVEQPAWVKLWHVYQLSDEEIAPLLAEVSAEFEAGRVQEPGVLLHVVGILLSCSSIGLYPDASEAIVGKALEQIESQQLGNGLDGVALDSLGRSYGGLVYHQDESEEISVVLKALKDAAKRAAEDALPGMAEMLLGVMTRDTDLFVRQICLTNSSDNTYYETPILRHVEGARFIEALLEVPSQNLHKVAQGIQQRYQFAQINQRLVLEYPWLETVANLLVDQAELRPRTMAGKRMRDFAETFRNAAKALGDASSAVA